MVFEESTYHKSTALAVLRVCRAHDLIHLAPRLSQVERDASVTATYHASPLLSLRRCQRGAHGRCCCKPTVDQDHDLAVQVR
jgi:hypothetical protein